MPALTHFFPLKMETLGDEENPFGALKRPSLQGRFSEKDLEMLHTSTSLPSRVSHHISVWFEAWGLFKKDGIKRELLPFGIDMLNSLIYGMSCHQNYVTYLSQVFFSGKNGSFGLGNTFTRWWFQIFFIFIPIWGKFPF